MSPLPVAILAGGLATRLRPLTERIPKVLVEVAGRPFVDWQFELLAAEGIERVVLCVGHLGEMVKAHVGDGQRFGLEVEYSLDGPMLIGTGGAVLRALPLLGRNFFILYGDSYLPVDYPAIAEAYSNSGREALMTVFENNTRWDKSNVWFEAGAIRLYDKTARIPQMRHIDYGLSVFSPQAFTKKTADEKFDLADVMKQLVAEGRMGAYEVRERFYEIGSVEGIADLENYLFKSQPPAQKLSPAVFFDRDGIINEIVLRDGAPCSPRQASAFQFKPGIGELFQTAKEAGFLRIIVTNQPDIERGLLAQAELDAMHRVLAQNLSPDGIEVCPAGSSADRRKKPNPGMLHDAVERWGVDLKQSWIVGDTDKDIEAGRRAGLGTILLETNYNKEVHEAADFCFRTLAEIANFLSTAPQRNKP